MTQSAKQELAHDLACLTIKDLEHIAAKRMDQQTRDYYNEGADHNKTLNENHQAYSKYRIRPRVLRDISNIDISATLFGHQAIMPIGVAPTAMQRMAHTDGELATARACKKRNVVMGLSSFSTTSLEDVAEELGDHPYVLQLYLMEEREHSLEMIRRAKKAGYKAVFLTVDTPMLGRRNGDIRNQFKLPGHISVANFAKPADASQQTSAPGFHDGEQRRKPTGPITFHTHAANPTLTWEESISWLQEQCKPEMEVWVKGIMTAEDAELAIKYEVDGVVVSNHGGRQLDGAMATIDALPEVVATVKGRIPVHVDGGIRHGTDAFKALALGADFVWIGRPALWGLAYKGQLGVELALRLYEDEFRLCMGLAGCASTRDINQQYLAKVDASGFVSKL